MDILRGFHPLYIGTLDFALCCGMDFLAEFFGGRFSVALNISCCRKTHTPTISGKIGGQFWVKTFPKNLK